MTDAELKAWCDFAWEGQQAGLNAAECIEYADAMLKTLRGQHAVLCRALAVAVTGLLAALPRPIRRLLSGRDA